MKQIDNLIDDLSHKDFKVQYAADQALRQIGKPAVEPLINAIKTGRIPTEFAADILGTIGDARTIDSLCVILNNDKNGLARLEAAKALGKIGKISIPYLIAALKHESPGTRQGVVSVLGELRDTKAIGPLKEVIDNDPEKEVRRSAKEALSVIIQEKKNPIDEKIDKILQYSADAQVGEVLSFLGTTPTRPMDKYQMMEYATFELVELLNQATKEERKHIKARLVELEQHNDWNVRRCAEHVRSKM